MKSLKNKSLCVLIFLLISSLSIAQPNKGKFIKGSIGFGYVAPSEDFEIDSNGFYLQGEYVIGIKSWFGVRPYAGVVFSSGETENTSPEQNQYMVECNAFLTGVKIRLCAPIPYVAPYIEIGIGASIGNLKTFTPNIDKEKSGVINHVPFSIGLAIGKQHNFELEATYYYLDAVEQFTGALAFGYIFDLD